MRPEIKKAQTLSREIKQLADGDPVILEQLRIRQAKLASLETTVSATTQKEMLSVAMEIAPPVPQDSEVQERQKAYAAVNEFMNSDTEGKYDGISKAELANSLYERIRNPEAVEQDQLNLCGPAAYAVLWAKYDPEGYTQAVIDLYEKGEYTYNGNTVKANKKTFEQDVIRSMDPVDWMLLPAIRHSEGFRSYNPAKDSGFSGFTLPWEVSAWIGNIVGVSKKKDGSPTIEEVNAAIDAKQTVVALVDWSQLSRNLTKGDSKKANKPESMINAITGNHYIIIKSRVEEISGGKVGFTIWTWGRDEYIELDKDKFSTAVKDTFNGIDED
jgi:hypothetical protein